MTLQDFVKDLKNKAEKYLPRLAPSRETYRKVGNVVSQPIRNYQREVNVRKQRPFFNEQNTPRQWAGKLQDDIKKRGYFQGYQSMHNPILMNPYIYPIAEPIVSKARVARYNLKKKKKPVLSLDRSNQDPVRKTIGQMGEMGAFGPIPQMASYVSKKFPKTTMPISHFASGMDVTGLAEKAAVGRLPAREAYKNYRTAGGITTGLIAGGPKLVASSAGLGGVLGAGLQAGSNVLQGKPTTQGIGKAAVESGRYGAETSPTFALVGSLTSSLAAKLPFMKPITDIGIKKTLPAAQMTFKEATKRLGTTFGKKAIRAALIETPIEGVIYGVKTQGEKEKLVDSMQREFVENLKFNVGFAGASTAWDARVFGKIMNKAWLDTIQKHPKLQAQNLNLGMNVKPIKDTLVTKKIPEPIKMNEEAQGKIFKERYDYKDKGFWDHLKSKGWNGNQIMDVANRVEYITKKAPGIIKNPEGFTYSLMRKAYPGVENKSIMGRVKWDMYTPSINELEMMKRAASATEADMAIKPTGEQAPVRMAEDVFKAKAEPLMIKPEPLIVKPEMQQPSVKLEEPTLKVETPKTERMPTKLVSNEEFGSIKTRGDQVGYIRNLKSTFEDYLAGLGTRLNQDKISVRNYQSGKQTQSTEALKIVMDKFADAIKKVDPNFKKKQLYSPWMLSDKEGMNVFKEIEDGIWITSADAKMGNIEKTRTGSMKLEEMEQDWTKILSRYSDQVLTKLYLNNLKGETPLEDAVLNYTKDVQTEIAGKTGKARGVEVPNFVEIGNKSYPIEQKSDVDLNPLEVVARENNNVMKKIGGKLYEAWGNVRDVTTKQIDIKGMKGEQKYEALAENSRLKSEALQNFVEQAGKTKLTPTAEGYVNNQISNMVSTRQLERNMAEVIFDGMGTVFARAHLWLSATTFFKQLTETTRLPSYYDAKTIKAGVAQVSKNPKAEAKRLSDTYKLKDFDDAFDLKRVREELSKNLNVKTATDIADKLGFGFLMAGERTKNIFYSAMAEQQGKAKGLEGDALIKYVREALFEQGNVASKYNRARLFDNSLTRLLFQYSSFTVKNTRQVVDAFQGKETKKALRLLASQLFNIGAIMAVTGLSGKYALGQLLPISTGPAVSFPSQMYDILFGRYSEETKTQKALRLAQQNLQPGGTQTIRTKEGLEASGGYNKAPAGGVRYFGEPASPFRTLQASVFGKNALPDVRSYYDKNRQVLGEQQTKSFEAKGTPEEKSAYAERVLSKRKGEKEAQESKSLWPFGAEEAVASVETSKLPAGFEETKILYKDAMSTIAGYNKKKTLLRYEGEDISNLQMEMDEAIKLKKMIESERPEQVFEIEIDVYKSGGSMDVGERAEWVVKKLNGAKDKEEFDSWYQSMLDGKVVTKSVLEKARELGLNINKYNESGKIKTYGAGGKKLSKPTLKMVAMKKATMPSVSFKKPPQLKVDIAKYLKQSKAKKPEFKIELPKQTKTNLNLEGFGRELVAGRPKVEQLPRL